MQKIVLATGNPHKVQELRALLGGVGAGVEFIGLTEAGGPFEEPDETGSTFEENARIKAMGYAARTGLVCLADDSGLEIDALHGRPGVISSHYATDGRETGLPREVRDGQNCQRVLRELAGVPAVRRGARFVCVMCLAEPGRVLASVRGAFEGRIGEPPRVPAGAAGFGYDPLFLVAPEFERTSAELTPDAKNLISHRSAAAKAMSAEIRRLFS